MKKKLIYEVETEHEALDLAVKINKYHDRISSNLKYEIDNHGRSDWLVTVELEEDYAIRFKEFLDEEEDSAKLSVPLGDKNMYLEMKGAADSEKKGKRIEKKVNEKLSLRIVNLIRKKNKTEKT